MKNKLQKILFASIYFLGYACEAATYCYIIPYLNNLGYSSTTIGILYALGAAIGIIEQFVIGYLSDKYKTIKKFFFYVMVIYIVDVIGIYLCNEYNIVYHIIFVCVNVAIARTSLGIVDTWLMQCDKDIVDSYSPIRAFGSIGWAFGSYSSIFVLDKFSYVGTSVYGIILCLFCLVAVVKSRDAIKVSSEKITLKSINALFKNKKYVVIIIIFFGICFMQSSYDTTAVNKLNAVGGTNSDVGFYSALIAICELPLFFFGYKLYQKFRLENLLLVDIIGNSIRFILYSFANSVDQVLLISTLQTITFPITTSLSLILVDKETPEHLKSSGQQLALALYSSLSALLAPLISGYLEDWFGINTALVSIGMVGIISLIATLIYKQMNNEIE